MLNSSTGDESSVQQISPAATIIGQDLFARHPNDAGISNPGSIRSFTLRVNGADTALTCTLTTPEQSCQNTTARVTIPPGSLLSMREGQGGASITGTGYIVVAWRATTP
jgi:hypothetical protein